MASAAAALLDELMGKNRNNAPDEKFSGIKWSDTEVCKHYLVLFCPNELFVNTRSDLGQCEKLHDDHLKKEYTESSRFQKMGYEEDFLQYLQQIMNDVEKRIKRGHSRLALNSNRPNLTAPSRGGDEEQIRFLTERINGLLEQVETLGCEGKVDEAQNLMKLSDKLTLERGELQAAHEEALDTILSQEKQMEVCEVCGAFLIVGDSQTRVDDHLMGKQHMGFAKIKSTIEEIKDKKHKEVEDREEKIRKEREDREKEREKEREDRKKKEREKEKEREREREERRKEREKRERERSRRRSRSRSRDRRRRSRSRDRRRSNSRDRRRSRSRDRSRRSRSKERSRSRRSRSREKRGDRRDSRSRDHKRSRSREKKRSRSRERKRSRSRERKRSRSRERKRSSDRDRVRGGSRSRHSSRSRRDGSREKSRERSRGKSREKSRERSSRSRRDGSRERSREKSRERSEESRHKEEHQSHENHKDGKEDANDKEHAEEESREISSPDNDGLDQNDAESKMEGDNSSITQDKECPLSTDSGTGATTNHHLEDADSSHCPWDQSAEVEAEDITTTSEETKPPEPPAE